MSEAARERQSRQAAIRTIRSGERSVYQVLAAPDGSWSVLARPWLVIDANDRRSALEATRAAVVEWRGVCPDQFDVE
jgi:hypothetical protein